MTENLPNNPFNALTSAHQACPPKPISQTNPTMYIGMDAHSHRVGLAQAYPTTSLALSTTLPVQYTERASPCSSIAIPHQIMNPHKNKGSPNWMKMR